jgi:hypothetical protein
MGRQVSVVVLLVGGALAGCSGLSIDPYVPVTNAVPPRASGPATPILNALACIRDSRALRGTRIAVAIHADGTGKYNHISEGSTGNYLPQGTTATYVSQAILFAGARPYNYYELNTERAMRAFANQETQKGLADKQDTVLPHYVLSTSFTALDFIGGPEVDIRIAGVGPKYLGRGAALEAVAEVYQPGTRTILRMSSIQRYIAFREAGVGISRFFGGGVGTLVTGAAVYADQQRLQEATRDVVALSVVDVLSRFPRVPAECRGEVEALLAGEGWDGVPLLAPAPADAVVRSRG